MFKEGLQQVWEGVRTTWYTKGDNLVLAWEVKSGKVPPLYVLHHAIGKQIASLPKNIRMTEPAYIRNRAQLMQEIKAA